jgi:hypothetical protein
MLNIIMIYYILDDIDLKLQTVPRTPFQNLLILFTFTFPHLHTSILVFMPIPYRLLMLFLLIIMGGNGLLAQADSTDLTLLTDAAQGQSGDFLEIPVRARNVQDVVTLQGSFHLADTSVAVLDSVLGFGLNGLGLANFNLQPQQNTLSFVWTEPQVSPLSLPDDSVLFRIRVQLTGPPGSQTYFRLDSNPTDLLVGYFNGGNLLPDSVFFFSDSLLILQNTPLMPGETSEFFKLTQLVGGNLRVSFVMNHPGPLRFELWEVSGKRLWEKEKALGTGRQDFLLQLPPLPTGLYLLKTQGDRRLFPPQLIVK